MIDYYNEIFTVLASALHTAYEPISVVGEYTSKPAVFPCVSMDEVRNIPTHLDSAGFNRYAGVTYKIAVFSNKDIGKRAEARKIYDTVDKEMQRMGFRCTSYSPLPEVYNASVYQITAMYEAAVGIDGTIYRN